MNAIKDLLQRIRNDRAKQQGTWIGIDESHIILNALEKSERIEIDNAEFRKQAVREFAEKLRDKEFSAKIGSEWVVVVKSLDIDELVTDVCGRMKKIFAGHIVKLQAATMRLFGAMDDDCPNWRAIRANERAIQKWLDKITDNADEQRQILEVIEHGNWNMKDTTFKPIFDELRALGYEIEEEKGE